MEREILIVTPSLQQHDAVSNDVYLQACILRERGHQVAIFSEYQDDYFSSKVVDATSLDSLKSSPNTLPIYHHSCYWEQGERILLGFQGPIIFRYHNITPPEFFPDDVAMQHNLTVGRCQSVRFIRSGKIKLYLGASDFNNEELATLGADRSKLLTLHPLHAAKDFLSAPINKDLADRRNERKELKVLFVGRIIQHKGHFHLLNVLEEYIRLYDSEISLTLVGKVGNKAFARALEEEINRRKLGGHVEVMQNVSFADLNTLYRSSDIFLMMSEHEGFGIPIVEAQICGLPVVVLNRGACKETLAGEGVSIDELDFAVFATALRKHNEIRSKVSPPEKFLDESGHQKLADIICSCI